MKNTTQKQLSGTVLAASIAAIGFSTLAQAEENSGLMISPGSQVELGVGYVSNGSYKFGGYGGDMQDAGTFLIGNVRVAAHDRDDPGYLELDGRDLGLDGYRNLRVKTGVQGNYGVTFQYGELSKLYSDTFQSPYSGMGTSVLTRPSVWTYNIVPTGTTVITTANMNDLAANMHQFSVETRRAASAFGLTKQLSKGWDVAINIKHEVKDGTKLTGAPMQLDGRGSRGVLLVPEPINYTTDEIDTMARFAGEKSHMQVGYRFSQFKNSEKSLVFDNLFYNSVSTIGGNALTGQIGEAPDNNFHQVNASAGYTISADTRLVGNLSLGRTTQNEAFLPYSTAASPAALPAGSLHGKVSTTHGDIKLASRLTRDMNVTAGAKYDDRDNQTPVNTYTYPTAGNTLAPGASNTRENVPLSKRAHAIYADMDYRLSSATKLKLGYESEKRKHAFEETTSDRENTVKAEVTYRLSDRSSGGLAYAHSDRKADPYNELLALAPTYTAAYLASLCVKPNTFSYNGVTTACTGAASVTGPTTPFLDTPALRKFFLADRKRDKVSAQANVAAADKLDLQFGGSYYKDRYPDTETGFGLTLARGFTANFDATLAATEQVSEHFFTSYESSKTHQNGHNGPNTTCSGTTGSDINRQNNTAAFDVCTGVVSVIDRSLTVGFGFMVRPGGSFDWGGDFTHVNTRGSTGFMDLGSRIAASVLPVPDTTSHLNRLEFFGKYSVRKNLMLNAKYAFEKFSSTDWAWDGQTYTSSQSFIGSGQTSPDYSVNVTTVSLSYLF